MSSVRPDSNGVSVPQLAEAATLPLVRPSGTLQLPQSILRSPMTAPQDNATASADQQPAAAQAWYNAVLAAGHSPDALAAVLSFINAEAARAPQSAGQPLHPASASAPATVRPPPSDALGSMAANPLSPSLKHLLQAGAITPEAPPTSQKHLFSQPQQVTTGDMHAHLHSSIRAQVSPLPDMPQPAGAKAAPSARSGPTPPPWPQPADVAQPSSQLPQQGSAKSGSEVLKRTFEARPESPPSKRLRFQGGIAELQLELSRRALEGGTPGALAQEAFPVASATDARSRRPRSHDLQAKDLTDMVRRDNAPAPRPESTFLKHLMDSIPRNSGAATAGGDTAPAWPLQPAERSRSGLSQLLHQAAAPVPAPASAAPAPGLSATQLLQKSLISELTGQAPRRLLDQLDPATLGLILATGGAPAASGHTPAPAAPLPVSVPTDPLASQALHLLQRAQPPEPALPAPASRTAAAEAPLSPQAAEQLYMRLEKVLGAPAAATLISFHNQKAPAQQVQPLQAPAMSSQPQLLDMLQAFITPGGALPPLHMRRDQIAANKLEPGRDSLAAASIASRPPLSVTLPAPSLAPRPAPAPQPVSFATAPQLSRRKQSPMLSLSGDRSAGLRAPRVDAAGLPHFGAPQLLTSSDLAKPVAAPQLALGTVDLRSGPAATLATPLPPPAPASASTPVRQPPAAAVDTSVSSVSIIDALTGNGAMSPQMRQRTLAAIGQYISDQGQAAAERGSGAASMSAPEAVGSAAAPTRAPPPDSGNPSATPPSDTAAASPAGAASASKPVRPPAHVCSDARATQPAHICSIRRAFHSLLYRLSRSPSPAALAGCCGSECVCDWMACRSTELCACRRCP